MVKIKLKWEFFAREPKKVAQDLLGMDLIRKIDEEIMSGMIVETEAYREIGKATKNIPGILRSPGKIYIMPYRGHTFLNIATEAFNTPSCVFIKDLMCNGEVYGPGKLTKLFKIDKSLDGKSITGDELWIDSRIEDVSYDITDNCVAHYRLKT